tara:strand:- start:1559 stop:1765 length:207 start_codon:yes stop_codon:yes gene_type:complete
MGGGVMANKRSLDIIWDALHEWQDFMYYADKEKEQETEERWDDICTAMAWIKENLEDLANAVLQHDTN